MRISNRHRIMVSEFHTAFRHTEIPDNPTVQDVEIRKLQARLILEEALEFALACGFQVRANNEEGGMYLSINSIEAVTLIPSGNPNLVEMADGLGDLEYVVHGASLAFGIPSEAVFAEIHKSNMSKLDDNGNPIVREDGKILKGPNYFEPRISKVLGIY